MTRALYFDNAASSPLSPAARDALWAVLDDGAANAGSQHGPGRQAAARIGHAAEQLAGVIGARADELVWTSGATEASNLALRGVAAFAGRGRGRQRPVHIVSCVTEHAATRDTLKQMAREGIQVTWLDVDAQGALDPVALAAALAEEPDLISLMQVNNETGVIHDIPMIAARCKAAGVPLHVDAAQSLGRLAIDVARTPIAFMSLSGHKIGAPAGIGALYARRHPPVGLAAQITGGGQQNGRRAGTLPTALIAAFGAAAVAAAGQRETRQAELAGLRDRLWAGLADMAGVSRNPLQAEAAAVASPFLNITVAGVHGEALREALAAGEPALAVSGGSACSAASGQSSYVLRAMGRRADEAAASLRFTLGPDNDETQVDHAIGRVREVIARLRQLAGVAA